MARISQGTLAAIVKQRAKVEQEQEKLKAAEDKLTVALKLGAELQPGALTARVREWERRNVAWKQILVREKGEDYAQRVFNATRPDKYETLVVELAG